jgi:Ribbon-helix-helix protein, copG family
MAQPKQLLAFRCERSAVEQLAELAREGDRSLSAEIRRAIREHVASYPGPQPPLSPDSEGAAGGVASPVHVGRQSSSTPRLPLSGGGTGSPPPDGHVQGQTS